MARKPEKPFLTVNDFARCMSVSERTVRNWLREARIPHIKLGSSVRIPTEVLDVLAAKSYDHQAADAKPTRSMHVKNPRRVAHGKKIRFGRGPLGNPTRTLG